MNETHLKDIRFCRFTTIPNGALKAQIDMDVIFLPSSYFTSDTSSQDQIIRTHSPVLLNMKTYK